MGKAGHLPVELLSALLDDELDPSAALAARGHLSECAHCSGELAAFARLDAALSRPPSLDCAPALELRSALLDDELSEAEVAIAAAHLAGCEACSAEHAAWSATETVLRSLPVAYPSVAVDAAVAALTAPRPTRRTAGPSGLGVTLGAFLGTPQIASAGPRGAFAVVAIRGALAAALVLALVAALLPGLGRSVPELAQRPAEAVLVAAVQEVVLNPRNNTLYVLQTAAAAVDAMDAASYALRARIVVGGRPTALALNEAANRVLVLDPGLKALIEIDSDRNAVVATTTIEVAGTPTSLQFDQANGKIVVAAVNDPVGGGPAPARGTLAPAPAGPQTTLEPRPASAGQVAIIDSTTMKLETIRAVEVAPRLVVPHPGGKQTLLVSSDATTIVDASYRTLRTLQGGISAAFDVRGDTIAVLTGQAGAAILHFYGDGAPALSTRLAGVPLAITSLPQGGFAVLVDPGSGNGRIIVVDGAGRAVAQTDVGLVGRDLAYDPATKRFTVATGGAFASAPFPLTLAAASPTLAPAAEGILSPAPTGTAAPSAGVSPGVSPIASGSPPVSGSPAAPPGVSSSPSASASPGVPSSPSASASPSASPAPAASGRPPAALPSAQPSPSSEPATAIVPPGAVQVGPNLYRLALPDGRMPVLTAASASRMWFIDQHNGINALDMATGEVLRFASLPKDARIGSIAVGAMHLYMVDAAKAQLFAFDIASERVSLRSLSYLSRLSALTVAPDGRLWMGLAESSQLISFDPRSVRSEAIDIGIPTITSLAVDNSAARVWFIAGEGRVGHYDLRSGRVTHLAVATRSAAHVLLAAPSGAVWLGTTAGEVLLLGDDRATVTLHAGRPVTTFAVDPHGKVWYLARATTGSGFIYGLADGSLPERSVPGPAGSLDFNLVFRAWIADLSGGFFLGVEGPR